MKKSRLYRRSQVFCRITHESSSIEPFKVGGGVMAGTSSVIKCQLTTRYCVSSRMFALNSIFTKYPMKFRMPAEGIEPTRSCDHWILSPARLPVPPRRREKIKLQKRSGSSSVRNNAWRPSHRFENEIRRLNTAWRTKNFPQNNRCARRVWGTQSLFPNCVGRCADARLIICSRDGHLCPRSSLRLFNPRTWLVSLGRNRW